MAHEMIKNSEDTKFLIFSDTLSSLSAINEKNPNHTYIHGILKHVT